MSAAPPASKPLQRTPLYERHVAQGAKMVPFAGYEMPVQYPPGILKEHQWTREKAGLFEKSGSHFSFKGERIAQGREKTIAYLSEHPVIAQEVRLLLTEHAKAECQMAPAVGTVPLLPAMTQTGAAASA